MIWEGSATAQIFKMVIAVVFIGTFLWKMVTKKWWWELLKKK